MKELNIYQIIGELYVQNLAKDIQIQDLEKRIKELTPELKVAE